MVFAADRGGRTDQLIKLAQNMSVRSTHLCAAFSIGFTSHQSDLASLILWQHHLEVAQFAERYLSNVEKATIRTSLGTSSAHDGQ